MRPIDAEMMKDVICDITNDAIVNKETKATMQHRLIYAVERVQTLDVKPVVHGKWHKQHHIRANNPFDTYSCTNCGQEFSWDAETGIETGDYSYCPNCGADMREVGDKE